MNHESEIFPLVTCTEISIEVFLQRFACAINEIIPPKIVRKYIDIPFGAITTTMEDISTKLLQYYTIEDIHKAFMELSEQEKHYVVKELEIMYFEFGAFPQDSLILVPEEPKDYIKPFFAGKLNIQDLLVD